MSKFIRIIQSYLLYSFPFVLACMAWETGQTENEILRDSTMMTRILWEVLSWNLMLWFAGLILFLIFLVISSEAREKTLRRLANLKERDEREKSITGIASRSAYISTLSLLIFFLFFSIFSLNIYRRPESEVINGKTKTIAIGLGFSLLDKSRVELNSTTGQVLFETKDIPLSKTSILLILIIWQLVIFNISARKENMKDLVG